MSTSNGHISPHAASPLPAGRAWAVRVFGAGFGLGYVPFAPGTWGTLPAVGAFLLVRLTIPSEPWQTLALAGLLLAACVASVPLGNWAQTLWGRKDPRRFVLDEVAGFLLTVLLFRRGDKLLPLVIWAFALTRAMDILKPPPARQLERLPGGWGILLDDLAASVYAAAALHLLYWLSPGLLRWGTA
jgi:phosphatidylglycerophosphatase A